MVESGPGIKHLGSAALFPSVVDMDARFFVWQCVARDRIIYGATAAPIPFLWPIDIPVQYIAKYKKFTGMHSYATPAPARKLMWAPLYDTDFFL
jgi:hypothetical protein